MDFNYEPNRISVTDEKGNLLAEITFPETAPSIVDINHTFVDDTLRGQGVAGKLVQAAAENIQNNKKKVILTCSYAKQWFDKHTEYQFLLADKAFSQQQ